MRRGGLGKGLGALIPPDSSAEKDSKFRELPVSSIRPNSHQPRQTFDEESLASLAASVHAVGVIQPVIVRASENGEFELVAGERRWRAAHRAGLQFIPAIIQEISDSESLERAVIENLHRQDLNAIEEAAAYQQLNDDFGMSHEEIARRVGKSRAAITNTLRLLQLSPVVQQLVVTSELSAGHARALLSIPTREVQEELATNAIKQNLSVRALEEITRQEARTTTSSRQDHSQSKRRLGVVQEKPASILELESLLEEKFETRVSVDMRGSGGRLTFQFGSLQDLDRIFKLMGTKQQSDHETEGRV